MVVRNLSLMTLIIIPLSLCKKNYFILTLNIGSFCAINFLIRLEWFVKHNGNNKIREESGIGMVELIGILYFRGLYY